MLLSASEMALLQEKFPGRVVSRHDATEIMRFHTVGLFFMELKLNVRERVYADKPFTLEHLKAKMRQVMGIPPYKSGRKLHQTVRSLRKLARRALEWH